MARQKSEIKEEPGFVVTPRMLETGAEALSRWRRSSDYQIVASVYRAMAAQAPGGEAGNMADIKRAVIEALTVLGYSAKRDEPMA